MESWEIVKAFADIGLVAFVWQLIPVLPCVRVPVFRARRMRAREAAEGWMSCGRRLVAGAAVDDLSAISYQLSAISYWLLAISFWLLARGAAGGGSGGVRCRVGGVGLGWGGASSVLKRGGFASLAGLGSS
jgi:hypothetical protein